MADGMRVSKLLDRFDAEIVASRSLLEADLKRAERAAYLTRLGHHVDARSELDASRARHQSTPNAAISSWLHLADGLIGHFSEMSPIARSKILRAHALSSAANLPRINALAAGWMAHMDYLQVNFDSMGRYALEAIRLSSEREHGVRSRVSLVVAQAFHVAGSLDLALPWYAEARRHAAVDEDEATLSALMHNMAWLRAQRLRVADCGLALQTSDGDHALLGAESTANYDSLIGSTSWPALVPILRAQILTVQKQYPEALVLFEAEMVFALRGGMERLHADLMADQAWCRAELGQYESALRDARVAESGVNHGGQFDDRAIAHGRLAQVFSALGRTEDARRNRDLAERAWAGHTSLQARLLEILKEMPPR